jgi:hypothetical protein
MTWKETIIIVWFRELFWHLEEERKVKETSMSIAEFQAEISTSYLLDTKQRCLSPNHNMI